MPGTVTPPVCAKCGSLKRYYVNRWRCRRCLSELQTRRRRGLTPERAAAERDVANAHRAVRRAARTPAKRADDIARVQRWREANRDRHRRVSREWYQANIEHARAAKLAEYYREREKFYARNLVRKARLRDAVCEHGPECVDATFLAALYASECCYCGAPAEHADHFVALSRGGVHCRDNLVPACGPCNSSKYNRDPSEWMARRQYE